MIGIEKIIVSDKIDTDGDSSYNVEVQYYFETGKNRFGSPALDLSQKTNFYSLFQDPSGKSIVRQDLMFPTFLDGSLNPTVKKLDIGFRYPFSTIFSIKASEALNFSFELSFYRKSKQQQEAIIVELFRGGQLQVESLSQRGAGTTDFTPSPSSDNIPVEDQRTNFYNNIFDIKVYASGPPSTNSTVSDLLVSYGKDKSVRGTFIFDIQKFLMNNSDFGYLLSNSRIPTENRRAIIGRSNIIHMGITRRKVSDIRDFQNKPYISYKNQIPKAIVAAGTQSENLSIATSTGPVAVASLDLGGIKIRKGSLVEISDLDLGGMDYEKVIAFNDKDLVNLGKHQYSLNMRIQDGILGWMVKTTDDLIELNSDLELKSSKMRFLAFTILTLNQDLNISQNSLISYLKNMIKHEGSLNILKSYITSLVSTLTDIIGKSGVTSQVNSSYSKVYSKDNLDSFFLTVNRDFGTIVDFERATDPTYDYLGFAQNSTTGPTLVSKSEMKSRADREFRKLIKNQLSSFAELSTSIYQDVFNSPPIEDSRLSSAYFNFELNYYAFLSPIKVGQTNLNSSNMFNFDIMTNEHFKKSYDDILGSQLSISYYLQQNGMSLNRQFFNEDPPLQDASQKKTYLPVNSLFSDSDGLNTERVIPDTVYTSGLEVEPQTNASNTFANMFLRNREKWELSREDFDLSNSTNIISALGLDLGITLDTEGGESAELKVVRAMPNQIRAIFASKSDKCVNQWLSPSIEGDYIYDPNTYYTIKQNYMNLVKIDYLSGFKEDVNGLPDVRNPIFEKLTNLNSNGKILCRASIYNDERFRIGVGFDRISYPDEYFIIDLTE